MSTSKAIAALERRHEYLIKRMQSEGQINGFIMEECSALEAALDALASKLLADRTARAARYAMIALVNRGSGC